MNDHCTTGHLVNKHSQKISLVRTKRIKETTQSQRWMVDILASFVCDCECSRPTICVGQSHTHLCYINSTGQSATVAGTTSRTGHTLRNISWVGYNFFFFFINKINRSSHIEHRSLSMIAWQWIKQWQREWLHRHNLTVLSHMLWRSPRLVHT